MPLNEPAYRTAVNLARRGEMRTARRMLYELIKKQEDDAQVWVWLAATYAVGETRVRILELAIRRFPESDLLHRALETMQRSVVRTQDRLAEKQEPALQPKLTADLPNDQVSNAAPPPTGAKDMLLEQIPDEEPGSKIRESIDVGKLALAVGIVLLTVITAYLWVQLR